MDRKIDESEIRKEKIKRTVRIVLIAGAVTAGTTLLLREFKSSVDMKELIMATADNGPLETAVNAAGRVVPAYEEIINSPLNSRIVEVPVQPGDSVTAGTTLLRLDLESAQTDYEKLLDQHEIRRQELTQLRLNNSTALSELRMQIKVKEMDVERLKGDADNERRLDSIGSGTGERVRQAQTAYLTATLELNQLNERLKNEALRHKASERIKELELNSFEKDMRQMLNTLEESRIPAPINGVVTYVNSSIGSRVGAGEKVAVVSDLSNFKIAGEIAESSIQKVVPGAETTVRIGKDEFRGHVTNLTPQAQSGIIGFNVELDDSNNQRLRSGMQVELYVNYGYKASVTRISNGSYFKGPGEYELFVKEGDILVKRRVKLGDSNRDFVEVTEGLMPGDKVVISNTEQYKNSNKLKIKE